MIGAGAPPHTQSLLYKPTLEVDAASSSTSETLAVVDLPRVTFVLNRLAGSTASAFTFVAEGAIGNDTWFPLGPVVTIPAAATGTVTRIQYTGVAHPRVRFRLTETETEGPTTFDYTIQGTWA